MSKALLAEFCYLQPQRSLSDEGQRHQTLYVNVRYLSRSMGNAPQRRFLVRAERRKQSPFHGPPAVKSYAAAIAAGHRCACILQ
jgi:hypothetical protein